MIAKIIFDDEEYFTLAKILAKSDIIIPIFSFEFDKYPVHIKLDTDKMTMYINVENTAIIREILRDIYSHMEGDLSMKKLQDHYTRYFEFEEIWFNV